MHDQCSQEKITAHITFKNLLYIAKWINISHISKILSSHFWTTPKCTSAQMTQSMKFKYAQYMGNTRARRTLPIGALAGYYPTSNSVRTPKITNAIMFIDFNLCHNRNSIDFIQSKKIQILNLDWNSRGIRLASNWASSVPNLEGGSTPTL